MTTAMEVMASTAAAAAAMKCTVAEASTSTVVGRLQTKASPRVLLQ